MFDLNTPYRFVTIESTEDGLVKVEAIWQVASIEGSLLHLHMPALTEGAFVEFGGPVPERNMVFNTASCFFHSPTLVAPE